MFIFDCLLQETSQQQLTTTCSVQVRIFFTLPTPCVTLYSISHRNYYKTTMTTRFLIDPRFVFILANAWDFRSHNNK